jgi:ATP-dependent DNA helicase RecG
MPALSPSSPVLSIDRSLATRRTGSRTKGPEARTVLLEAFGIETVGQLVHHYPRRYIDRSSVARIADLRPGEQATVIATVRTAVRRPTRRGRQTLVTVTISDGSGSIDLAFFNQPWTASTYRAGTELAVSGVPQRYRGRLQLVNQEVEVLRAADQDLVHTGRITPVHPATDGISARTIRELVWRALDGLPTQPDPLPADVVDMEGLSSWDEAIRRIHFPEDERQLTAARERLTFDELFVLELGVGFRRQRVAAERRGVSHVGGGALTEGLAGTLPFVPTDAQRRAVEAVERAMEAPTPMNLLLQGDVGSGKTLVAVHASLVAIASGHQAAIMAPTEVLAAQHARSVAALLEPMGGRAFLADGERPDPGQSALFAGTEPQAATPTLTYALLTGAVTGKQRERILEGVADGAVDLVIGTHALVQEAVTFHDLSLAVVDEQHRFGLHQRMALKGKGEGEIDVLIMTATPIPRTLALTYYGDLDVAVLDEMPAGRRPVRTVIVRDPEGRTRAEELVRDEAAAGRQAFVVCAAIDEGNRTQARAAEAEADRLRLEVFPDLHVELLHGRMRPKEKERIMEAFRAAEADVLISTTVIEVGVDIPNATVMVIEDADRFGLAQLHQLRGRIGRGPNASTCVLIDGSSPENVDARARIDAMARTSDGFVLADEDLRLRGEGTLFDARQSGMPDLRLARLAEDLPLVTRARERAFALLEDDPGLVAHPDLLEELRRRFERSIDWLFHS